MRSAGIEVQFLKRNPTGYVSLLEQKKDCGVAVPQPFWCVVNNQCNFMYFSQEVLYNIIGLRHQLDFLESPAGIEVSVPNISPHSTWLANVFF